MNITTEYLDGILTIRGTNDVVLAEINVPALYDATEGYVEPSGEVEIDPSGLSKIGNMTGGGGLASAFNGNAAQTFVAAAWYPQAASNAWAGLSFSSPKAVSKIVVNGSNDHGFAYTQNGNITITAYGKNGAAPTTPTGGQAIGSVGPFVDANSLEKEIIINNPQAWDYVWINITYDGTVVNGCSEIKMYEVV